VVPVKATDYSSNSRTNNYQVVVTNNVVAKTLTYDINGNLIAVVTPTSTNTYEWDAANRLTAFTAGTNRTEFTYDGLGRRVQIVERQNGLVLSTKKFLWCDKELCEERDSTGATVTKRFFAQGEQISGTAYFFSRDHLGSVREMTDSSQGIRARYDYDPYGRRTKISGDLDADFAFTGHYYHVISGFYLSLYRAYDPDTGRWISRDPIAEQGGLNLYAYVDNNPINGMDPLGLFLQILAGATIGAVIAGAAAAAFGGDWSEIKAAALGGAISGALVSSGLWLVAGALEAGTIGGGTALGAMGVFGATAGVVGNTTEQIFKNWQQCSSFKDAIKNVDMQKQIVSGIVGAVAGVISGGLSQLHAAITQQVQNTTALLQKSLVNYSSILMQQGASQAVIHAVQKQVVNGLFLNNSVYIQLNAALTTLDGLGVSTVEHVIEKGQNHD